MPVPEYITRDSGTTWERNYNYRGRRAALIGGVVMIALAFALPMIGQVGGGQWAASGCAACRSVMLLFASEVWLHL